MKMETHVFHSGRAQRMQTPFIMCISMYQDAQSCRKSRDQGHFKTQALQDHAFRILCCGSALPWGHEYPLQRSQLASASVKQLSLAPRPRMRPVRSSPTGNAGPVGPEVRHRPESAFGATSDVSHQGQHQSTITPSHGRAPRMIRANVSSLRLHRGFLSFHLSFCNRGFRV
jgi:hypothetical protein